MNREQMDTINNRVDQLAEEGVSSEIKSCKVKKLLNDEIVTGILNPDSSFTDIQVQGTPEYKIPADDKIQTYSGLWIEDVEEEFISKAPSVYKRAWNSSMVYYRVGYLDNSGSVVLQLPKFQETYGEYPKYEDPHEYQYDLKIKGYPKTVEKYSTTWYRSGNSNSDMKVSFVPSNDVYEVINTNKNESIGYISHEGKVTYWNQYRR